MSISSLRQRVLQEWRGLPEKKLFDRSIVITDVLPKVLHKLGLDTRIKEDEIIGTWRELVGDFLATHSEPLQLVRGILYVRVIQPTIRYELDRVWKPDVLRKLQERFGKKTIRDVKFNF
ncbi:MAG TPA: DUF721 domain-containing protein [Chthoniobacterales bacterium]|nr:DUF721 domain-containing protein [Chthoniobacterales bacterium]